MGPMASSLLASVKRQAAPTGMRVDLREGDPDTLPDRRQDGAFANDGGEGDVSDEEMNWDNRIPKARSPQKEFELGDDFLDDAEPFTDTGADSGRTAPVAEYDSVAGGADPAAGRYEDVDNPKNKEAGAARAPADPKGRTKAAAKAAAKAAPAAETVRISGTVSAEPPSPPPPPTGVEVFFELPQGKFAMRYADYLIDEMVLILVIHPDHRPFGCKPPPKDPEQLRASVLHIGIESADLALSVVPLCPSVVSGTQPGLAVQVYRILQRASIKAETQGGAADEQGRDGQDAGPAAPQGSQ